MAVTVAPTQLRILADQWEGAIGSAVLSGIVGDDEHQKSPGKHLSWAVNKAKFGSDAWPLVQEPGTAAPPNTSLAGAIDITMSRKDQNAVHNRFINLFNNRKTDPRAKYVSAFNGWNGSGSPTRYNMVTGAKSTTDDSHKWHQHVETPYRYANDPAMVKAIMSVVKGETVAEYQGEDMPTPEEYAAAVWAHKPNEDWPNARVQLMNLFQQLSGKVGNLPGNQNNFNDWRQTQDTVALKGAVGSIQATLQSMAGKDYVDEEALAILTADRVLSGLRERTDGEVAELLVGLFGEDRLEEILRLVIGVGSTDPAE